jgi:radical SAM protein with 4Fe4S-binding SPASM domain
MRRGARGARSEMTETTDTASIFFGVEVTRRCNLKCPHCYTASTARSHPGASAERIGALLGELAALGARHVAFSGGEPLLRDDLEAIMIEGRRRGLKSYSLVTNGSLATPERVTSLRRAGLTSVQVSLDGVDARDHCEIRSCSPRAYYRALRAIRLFREARVKVDVATILVGPNLERGPEMLLLAQALGVRYLRFCSFVPTGRASSDEVQRRLDQTPAKLDAFLEFFRSEKRAEATRAKREKRERDSEAKPAKESSEAGARGERGEPLPVLLIDHGIGPWRSDGDFTCMSGRNVAYISSDGFIYPCPGLLFDEFRVGNVYETPVAQLVASPAMGRVRTLGRATLAEPCRSCGVERCTGGCRGAIYAASGGDLLAPPTYCNAARRRAG